MGIYGSSQANVLAVKKETTYGVVVDPAAAGDYIALQNDLEMMPEFEELENAEIKSSIGVSKSMRGFERGSASFSHYLKHSGTEGTPPEYGDILESLFGGTSANATERLTTSSSTVSLLKLASGGSDFARGKAVLLKDTTNGYSIRPVHSVATNDLTLGFNLANAPATGQGNGKCVNYSPANTGHPSLSLHSYRGNGHAYEILSGAYCNEMNLNIQAGQLASMAFNFQGLKYHFNPIRIANSDRYLDFNDGSTDFAAVIQAGLYADPHELATALTTAMNAHPTAADVGKYLVEFLDNDVTNGGKFRVSITGTPAGTLSLEWNTGTNTANTVGDKLGFSVAADDTGSTSYVSDNAQSYASPYVPSLDPTDPLVGKNNELMIGDAADYACFCAQQIQFQVTNEITDIECVCSETGIDQKKITRRMAQLQVTALLDKHDADKFRRMRENSETRVAFNFGVRDGAGNWIPGLCGNVYMPTCVVTNYQLTDLDTVIGLTMTIKAYVDSNGSGEVYLNFL